MEDSFNPLMTGMQDQGDKLNIDEYPDELTLSVSKVPIYNMRHSSNEFVIESNDSDSEDESVQGKRDKQ